MKHSIFYLFVFLFFSSCITVQFETIDFISNNLLDSIPSELQGSYISSNGDTIVLTGKILDMGYDPISKEKSIDTLKHGFLEIAKLDDYYLLCKKEKGLWTIIPIYPNKNKLEVYYLDEDEYVKRNFKDSIDENKKHDYFFSELNKITPTKKVYNDSGEIDYYLINPSKKQFKKLLGNNFFSKLEELNRL